MNMLRAFIYQCNKCGFINGFFIDKNSRGIFSKRSHITRGGKPKVCYPTEQSATQAANALNRKNGTTTLSAYKCGFCDGYHIGNDK